MEGNPRGWDSTCGGLNRRPKKPVAGTKVKPQLVLCGRCLTPVKTTHTLNYQYGGTWKAKNKKFKREIRPMDIFSASDKATYDRRKQMVAERWAEYEEDQNPIHLAAICRDYPSSIIQMSVKKSRAYF